ncbi:MAG TPA: TonB family protein [Candidatus Omnitrophota bacterium]|nr:TonB family protein [Candidatus Omnitrophota bacterium]
MFSERVFQFAFIASLITHAVILFQNPNLNLMPSKINQQKIEVNYVRPQKKDPPRELLMELPSKLSAKRALTPFFKGKQNLFQKNEGNNITGAIFNKPASVKPEIISIKKKITLTVSEDLNKSNNTAYIVHSQIVREKIKRALYHSYSGTDTGEVNVVFVVFNDGRLKEARVVEEKSSSNAYLKEISLRSLREASPFPPFPKQLDYPQLSFNVVISFEIGE